MPVFDVDLNGYAHMRQRQRVEASNVDEAIEIALSNQGDHLWTYEGVEPETIEVDVSLDNRQVSYQGPSMGLQEL